LGGTNAARKSVGVAPTTGTVAIAGSFNGMLTIPGAMAPVSSVSGLDSFVAAYDSSGKFLWLKQITDATATPGDQVALSVAANDGKVAVAGYYTTSLGLFLQSSPSVTTADAKDAFVLGFRGSDGTFEEDLEITSKGTMGDQIAYGVALSSGAIRAVTGTTSGTTSFNGVQVMEASSDPNIFFATYSGTTNTVGIQSVLGDTQSQNGKSVAFDGAGNVLLGATFLGSVDTIGQNVVDGGPTLTTAGGLSVLVASYLNQNMLSCMGATQFGSSVVGNIASLAGALPFGSTAIYMAGGFAGAATFPGDGGLTSAGGEDVFVAKLDPTLQNVLWAEKFGDSADQSAQAIALDSDGSVLIAGQFLSTLDFGAPTTPLHNPTANVPQIFVAKLKP
jgi:hypothetical protein